MRTVLMVTTMVLFGMTLFAMSVQDWNNAGIAGVGCILFVAVLLVWELVEWFARKIRGES